MPNDNIKMSNAMINRIINRIPVSNKGQYADLIYKHIKSPLSSVPFHEDVEGLQRFVVVGFPYHLAIHQFVRMYRLSGAYTQPHDHPFDELNIILGDDLVYEILLGHESFIVRGDHSIWIPAGLTHAANVISGTGYYVTLRLDHQ